MVSKIKEDQIKLGEGGEKGRKQQVESIVQLVGR